MQPVGADPEVEVRPDESRQQRLVGRHRHHQDQGRDEDPAPEPGDARDVAEAGGEVAPGPLGRLRVEAARPGPPEERGREDEGRGVEREHRGRARRPVDERGQRRPADRRGLARDVQHRVRGGEERLLDDERHDPAEGRLEEAVREPDQRHEHEDRREREAPRRVERREDADQDGAGEVGADHQPPPRIAVGDHPADQERRQQRRRLEREHEAERARRAGQGRHVPADRDEERRVPGERDRLAAPEEPEVAAAECRDGAAARSGLHPGRGYPLRRAGSDAGSRALRRRLHARAPGARPRPRGLRPSRRAPRAPARRRPPRRGPARRLRGAEAPPRARARRRGLDRLHRADRPRDGRRRRRAPTSARPRWWPPGRTTTTSSSTRTRCRCSTRCAAAGSSSASSRTRAGTSRRSSSTTGSRWTSRSARARSARRSPTRRSSGPRSTGSASSPARAAMVGDSIEDDIEGALALGMRAILLDREGRYPELEPRITGLGELLPVLGL